MKNIFIATLMSMSIAIASSTDSFAQNRGLRDEAPRTERSHRNDKDADFRKKRHDSKPDKFHKHHHKAEPRHHDHHEHHAHHAPACKPRHHHKDHCHAAHCNHCHHNHCAHVSCSHWHSNPACSEHLAHNGPNCKVHGSRPIVINGPLAGVTVSTRRLNVHVGI